MSTYAIKADAFYLPTRVARGGYLMVEDGVFGEYVTDAPAVSYTHLDVYKRQVLRSMGRPFVRDSQMSIIAKSLYLRRWRQRGATR